MMLTNNIWAGALTDLSWENHGVALREAEAKFLAATDAALEAGERRFDSPEDTEAILLYERAMEWEREAATALAELRRNVGLRLPIRSQKA